MDVFKSVAGAGSSQSYDGSTDPKEFLRLFELQSAMLGWDATKQLTFIPLFLTDKAKRVFDKITDKSTIALVSAGIISGCSKSQDNMLYEFYGRKLGRDESITKFALSLQDLLTRAIPTMGENERNCLLRAQLCSHLPDHLKAMVQFNSQKT